MYVQYRDVKRFARLKKTAKSLNQIGDALIRLKYPQGGFLSGINMWSPTRHGYGANTSIIGEVTTVKVCEAVNSTTLTA